MRGWGELQSWNAAYTFVLKGGAGVLQYPFNIDGMKCGCSFENPAGAAYCERCGQKLFAAAQQPRFKCVHCSREFSLENTVWCMCETDTPTYVCPFCERCACRV